MTSRRYLLLLLALTCMSAIPVAPPPPTRVEEVRETMHGVEVRDSYRWLEDQEAPETRGFIDAQERHARAVLDALPERAAFLRILEPMFGREDRSTPWVRGGRLVFMRRLAGEQLESICTRDSLHGKDRVLVDPRVAAPDGGSVVILAVAHDGSRVAYGVRLGGADEVELRVVDAATGAEVAERLPRARYAGVTFEPDGRGLVYARHGTEGSRVRRHRFGADPAQDQLIFGEGRPPGQGISVDVTPDGRWLVATIWHGSAARRAEIFAKDLSSDGPFLAIVDDIDARFSADLADGRLFVQTNWLAPNGRVIEIDLARPGRENWREVVGEGRWPMQEVSVVGGRLAVSYLENVRPVVRVFDTRGRQQRVIESPGLGSMTTPSGDWDSDIAFIASSSWTEPETIESIDLATGARATWWQAERLVPKDEFVIEQHWFVSSDGTRVPLFLGRRKDAHPRGDAPALAWGYGGFLLSQLPSTSPRAAAWLRAGGIVVLPSLRGGAEFGEAWHEQGMRARKQQTFDDLYGAVTWLHQTGWTRPERTCLFGRSNGGLLVGAALTQRPDLFRAVVCGYPLLDMLRYDQFLVAKFWVPEYGSATDPEQFGWLRAYSPYQHVKPGVAYPATLFVTGDADTRVAPLHARKMAALLQASTSSGLPVLLHYDTKMGHVGGQPADKDRADLSDELGFLAWQVGLKPGR